MEEKLINELKSFRRQLDKHDLQVRAEESLRHFFNKEGNEMVITLKEDSCNSKISVSINGKVIATSFSYLNLRGLNNTIIEAIREVNKT